MERLRCEGLAAAGSRAVTDTLCCAATAAPLNMQSILNASRTALPALHAGGLAQGVARTTHPRSLHEKPFVCDRDFFSPYVEKFSV